ncbi:HD-GYP domain-containing protein [Fibrobacterota bacterium]
MPAIPLEKLQPEQSYQADILDEQGAVLIPAGTRITQELIQWIASRNVNTVYSNDSKLTMEADLEAADALIRDAGGFSEIELSRDLKFDDLYQNLGHIQSPRMRPSLIWYQDNLQTKTLDSRLTYLPSWDTPQGTGMASGLLSVPVSRSEEYKQSYLRTYRETLADVKTMIDRIAQGTLVSAHPISVLVERVIEQFIKDKNLMLNFSLIKSLHKENMYHHSLNVCILAINIAAAVGYSQKQVHEIGVGALLHDLGMMLVNTRIRYKTGGLTSQEHAIVQKHPIEGLFLISKIKGLPESAGYIIYQHHERDDGSGYPRARRTKLMHKYARIVGLADMFDAMTSDRPYRKAFSPYDTMLELLHLVQRGKVSADLMRFFIEYSSIFPIGSYVRLSDGRLAKVVEARGSKYVSPVVSVVNRFSKGETAGIEKIDLSKVEGKKIISAVPALEVPNASILGEF